MICRVSSQMVGPSSGHTQTARQRPGQFERLRTSNLLRPQAPGWTIVPAEESGPQAIDADLIGTAFGHGFMLIRRTLGIPHNPADLTNREAATAWGQGNRIHMIGSGQRSDTR